MFKVFRGYSNVFKFIEPTRCWFYHDYVFDQKHGMEQMNGSLVFGMPYFTTKLGAYNG